MSSGEHDHHEGAEQGKLDEALSALGLPWPRLRWRMPYDISLMSDL